MGDNEVVTNQIRFLMILFYSSAWVPPLHAQVLDNFLGQGSTKSHSLKEVFWAHSSLSHISWHVTWNALISYSKFTLY